jgi:hypothetical protein
VSTVQRLHAPTPRRVVELLCASDDDARPVGVSALLEALVARLQLTSPPASGTTRVDAFVGERGPERFATPFRWSARTARRPLGTGALRRMSAGTSVGALDAAREELEASCDRAERGLARRGALGTWLAATPREVRAVCVTEAATWATALCQLIDWNAHADRLAVGIPDAWFDVPAAAMTLHGRLDAASVRAATRAPGILRLRDGAPGDRAVEGLLVDGLVAAMARGARGEADSMPSRVLGAWPDTGSVLVVDLDAEHLRAAARTVVACVTASTLPAPGATPRVDAVLAA